MTADDLAGAKSGMIVMHPLPRVEEIDPSVDSTNTLDISNKPSMGFQPEWPCFVEVSES